MSKSQDRAKAVPLKHTWHKWMAVLNHFHDWVSEKFILSGNAAEKVKFPLRLVT